MRRMSTRQLSAGTKHYTEGMLPGVFRLLSFNMQLGIRTRRYHHYFTRSWQHLLPVAGRRENLHRIGHLIRGYDVVVLQETDGGSLRTGFVNQTEYLARCGGFPLWYQQMNRNFGYLAKHCNGVLCQQPPVYINDHPLPGLPGRGIIEMRYQTAQAGELTIIAMHLALSRRGRNEQLACIRDRVKSLQHYVLAGDMNAGEEQLLHHSPLKDLKLKSATQAIPTFPSWNPYRSIDHIFVSEELSAVPVTLPDIGLSDHLPVAVSISLPGTSVGAPDS